MFVIASQAGRPEVETRRPRVGRRTLLMLAVLSLGSLGLASFIARELWWRGYFLALTTDFDRASYARVRGAIEADPHDEGGRPFEEVARELHLADVAWDDASFQQEPGLYRIYHYPGFALHATLRRLPIEVTPATPFPWDATRTGDERTWLVRASSFVRVDGLDRAERMRRYWRAIQDECDRINDEMRRARQTATSPET